MVTNKYDLFWAVAEEEKIQKFIGGAAMSDPMQAHRLGFLSVMSNQHLLDVSGLFPDVVRCAVTGRDKAMSKMPDRFPTLAMASLPLRHHDVHFNKAQFDTDLCILCGNCAKLCPNSVKDQPN